MELLENIFNKSFSFIKFAISIFFLFMIFNEGKSSSDMQRPGFQDGKKLKVWIQNSTIGYN